MYIFVISRSKSIRNNAFFLNLRHLVSSNAAITGSWWLGQIKIITKPRKTFDILNSKSQGKWLEIVAVSVKIMVFAVFWRSFLTEITVKSTKHAHIRDQRVKIYKNPCFVFNFTSLVTWVFNGFSNRHFDRKFMTQKAEMQSET